MLLNLLKKIELKSTEKSGQKTHRVTDLKIPSDLLTDSDLTRAASYRRSKKPTSTKRPETQIPSERTFLNPKILSTSKVSKGPKKTKKNPRRLEDHNPTMSKKV